MSDWVIQTENLGKCYHLSTSPMNAHQQEGFPSREFWALRHIDLEIPSGDIFGVIGANGSGKSTLLKLLTAVTAPSEGVFRLKGRINALLELGTGFHPELTGTDNLFVGGALHGISRQEIKAKLKSIIDFSELGDAVTQPLRTYSSGMYIRLAFSLAVHTNPEILLLDEILAVGDERFQRKCFETIREFHRKGVTILFVSHDLKLISLLCNRVVLLKHGQSKAIGGPTQVIDQYNQIRSFQCLSGKSAVCAFDSTCTLYHRNQRLTGNFGIYTSIRSDYIWYDSKLADWSVSANEDGRMILDGTLSSLKLQQKWIFTPIEPDVFQWRVILTVTEMLPISRLQCNIMLDPRFTRYQIESTIYEFPADFRADCGEDWTRLWIGSPGTTVTVIQDSDQWRGNVMFSVEQTDGALLVINSNEEFQGRVIQYLKVYPLYMMLPAGEHTILTGLIRVGKSRCSSDDESMASVHCIDA